MATVAKGLVTEFGQKDGQERGDQKGKSIVARGIEPKGTVAWRPSQMPSDHQNPSHQFDAQRKRFGQPLTHENAQG